MPALLTRLTARSWFWFGIAFLLFGVHVFTSRFHIQVYDANGYRELAYKLYNGGDFALLRFDSALRGYLYPLLYVPIVALANAQSIVSEEALIKLVGALVAGAIFGWLPALLWQRVTGTKLPPLRRGAFIVVGFLLWRDYFNYMLTDFPAVAGLVGALCLLLPRPTLAKSVLAGLLVAAVINMRPVYLVALPSVLAVGSWLAYHDSTRRWHIAVSRFLGAYALGFMLLSAPQWYINWENFGINRPLVIGIDYTDPAMVATGDLYLQKITDGFTVQKYETGIAVDYSNAQVQYLDLSGTALLALDFNRKMDSYGEYLQFVLRHPLDMLGLNARHLFNGLDVLYPTPYLYRVYTTTGLLAGMNYTLLFVAIIICMLRLNQLTVTHILLISALLIPALISVPLPVECRYVLSLHLLLVAIACFGWPATWTWRRLAPYRLPLVLTYLLFLTLCFTLSGATQALLREGPKLLN
ncbi:hypothetical protein J7E24_03325 [Hymenobacter sp. ISL-91]|uniref:hypothetical protein n=1 Tax=Hymenobacter sp. ISL-91 TaxID=2819151 RepID=UPI001BE8CDDC|nr:hypothetical protein [Hymenobacter sp. ISL-91]MBT2556802.1 hypothetical protein [Hymenobacter sp. ISL-91]